jgi:hypothetical protein
MPTPPPRFPVIRAIPDDPGLSPPCDHGVSLARQGSGQAPGCYAPRA